MRKIILYIVYGDDKSYYEGAIFSFLTFMYWSSKDQIEIVVLTEKPELFIDYKIQVLKIPKGKKKEWSLNGKYHFRIKNRGLAYAMDQLKMKSKDKILFFDTDTYFHKSPLPLFDLIQPNQALMYINEGNIHKRKRFNVYVEKLNGKIFKIDGENYSILRNSSLWGSLMIGVMSNMRKRIDWADSLLLKLYKTVPAHTIEEFSLSEGLLRDYKLVEGKKFVSLYSTSRKKEYAKKIISNFFYESKAFTMSEKIKLAQNVKIIRPASIVLKQRLARLFTS